MVSRLIRYLNHEGVMVQKRKYLSGVTGADMGKRNTGADNIRALNGEKDRKVEWRA